MTMVDHGDNTWESSFGRAAWLALRITVNGLMALVCVAMIIGSLFILGAGSTFPVIAGIIAVANFGGRALLAAESVPSDLRRRVIALSLTFVVLAVLGVSGIVSSYMANSAARSSPALNNAPLRDCHVDVVYAIENSNRELASGIPEAQRGNLDGAADAIDRAANWIDLAHFDNPAIVAAADEEVRLLRRAADLTRARSPLAADYLNRAATQATRLNTLLRDAAPNC